MQRQIDLDASFIIKVVDEIAFTEKTIEGIDMKFLVTNEEEKTCEVYSPKQGNNNYERAIDTSTEGEVTIPSHVKGYTVTGIGDWAFSDCDRIKSVIIPNTVTSIKMRAFSSCRGLTSIIIPESVTSIGRSAFQGCI